MKRWIKNTITVTLGLVPIGLVAAFSNSWSNKTPISCVGSSTVKPFIEDLSKIYMQANPNVDITVEAGGSGFGIQQIAQGFANIGNASKDPYSTVKGKDAKGTGGFRKNWEESQIKTITIGWEAICLVYIPPKNLNVDADTLNKMLVVNDTESNNPNLKNQYGSTMHKIEELMRVFSGINDSNAPIGNPTLYDFYNSNTNLSSTQIESLKSTKITPYVRAGGSLTSGTASSFVNESHLTFKKTDLSKQQQKAFDNGNYGTAYGLQQTDEANSRAWDMFTKSDNPGQIVYLSSGFVQQNSKLIKSKGYGIMAYGNNVTYSMEAIDTKDGYNWFRPLNSMISLNSKSSVGKDFLKTILNEYGKPGRELEKLGAKSLQDSEKSQMFTKDFPIDGEWLSDVKLAERKLEQGTDIWEDINWHGEKGHFAPTPEGLTK